MHIKPKLLIFDWDGTLMDSIGHITASLAGACSDLDIKAPSEDAMRNIIGLGMREAVFTLFPDYQTEEFIQEYTAAYRKYYFADDAPQSLFSGVEDTLEELLNQGYLLAVATGKSRKGLDKVFEDTGLGPVFHTSRCADETQSKPHPQMLEEILAELEVGSELAVMVGDTEYDMEMAQSAGVHRFAVTHGVHGEQHMERFKPAAYLDSIPEIIDVLSSLQGNQNRNTA